MNTDVERLPGLYGRIARRLLVIFVGYPLGLILTIALLLIAITWTALVGASWQFVAAYFDPWWARIVAVALLHCLSRVLLEVRQHRPDIFGLGEVVAAWLIFWQALGMSRTEGFAAAIAIGGAVYLCADGTSHVHRWLRRHTSGEPLAG